MDQPRHRARDRVLASQGRRSLTEAVDHLKQTGSIMLKDLGLFLALCLARFMVWRELRRRRKADPARQGSLANRRDASDYAAGERLRLAQARRMRMEQERYLAEIAKNRQAGKSIRR